MPEYLRTSGYKIYFWSNETGEPIHFHATKGNPNKDDTKIWLLSNGSLKLAHNKGKIPQKDLSRIFSTMQTYFFDYINFWKSYFNDDVKFYE